MNCPKCCGKLQEKYLEKVKVDVCYICEGIWFDTGELEEVIKRDAKNFSFIDVGRDEFDGKEIQGLEEAVDKKTGECPRCEDGVLLVQEKHEGKESVNIDVCPKGHGLWLDGGEILQLRQRTLVNCVDLAKYFINTIKSFGRREK